MQTRCVWWLCIQGDHRQAPLYCFRDNLASATDPPCWSTVPDRKHQIAMIEHYPARGGICLVWIIAAAIKFQHSCSAAEQIVKCHLGLLVSKVASVFASCKRQRALQSEAEGKGVFRNQAVRPLGKRRDATE